MKARHHALSLATLIGLSIATSAVSVEAQRASRGQPRPDTPRLVVHVFGSTDFQSGPQASDALRDRMISAFPARVLWVFEKEEVVGMLEESGYDPNRQLGRADEATLARHLRADEYIRGNVVRTEAGWRVDAQLVLTRDAALTQPLPPAEGNRPDRAGIALLRAIQDARKQLPAEQRCLSLAREDKLDEAVAAADAGIREYPNATLVRYCKMNVLARREAPLADRLQMAEEILEIDPNSRAALAVAADAQKEMGNTDVANNYLVRLLSTDPTNSSLAETVVDALAASGKYDVAKEIVVKAVDDNPGNLELIRLQFLIMAASGEHKTALQIGEEMIQMDTSLADVAYFQRMAALYASDSQPQKSAEVLARGTQKFPNNADVWQFYAQALRSAGQLQQSIDASKRALEIKPDISNGWTQVAIAYNEMDMPDSALAALRRSADAGDSGDVVGGYALNIGNRFFTAANAQDPKVPDEFEKALPFLHFADSTITSDELVMNAKFLIGVSSFFISSGVAQEIAASKSCDVARRADGAASNAAIYLQAGARVNPQVAGQLLPAVGQLMPYTQAQVKALCN